MNWYAPIPCSNTVDNPLVADDGNCDILQAGLFRRGESLGDQLGTLRVNATDRYHDGTPDDVLQTYLDLPVYSRRLRQALEHNGISGIEYVPLKVSDSQGLDYPGFAIANIRTLRPALDLRASRYSVFGPEAGSEKAGTLRGLIKPVLLATSLMGIDILRAAEYQQRVFLSERFKRVFEANLFTGYSFRSIRVT